MTSEGSHCGGCAYPTKGSYNQGCPECGKITHLECIVECVSCHAISCGPCSERHETSCLISVELACTTVEENHAEDGAPVVRPEQQNVHELTTSEEGKNKLREETASLEHIKSSTKESLL